MLKHNCKKRKVQFQIIVPDLRKTSALISLLLFLFVAGCKNNSISPTPTQLLPTATHPAPISTQEPTKTIQPTLTVTPSPTSTTAILTSICSPLQDISLEDLHSITSQGFKSPSPFLDDGHPAVDLAFFTFEDLPSMLGHPVQAILPGKVVQVLDNRYPYGNMILIETSLELLPENILPMAAYPTPIPAENVAMFSPCTQDPLYSAMTPIEMSTDTRSLYTLYSHLKDKPALKTGDLVACGQTIGAVGITGNSVAEHLHLEIRIGPAEARFNSLAMYQPDATTEERYNYCIWSTSGRFQPIDPALFWTRRQ